MKTSTSRAFGAALAAVSFGGIGIGALGVAGASAAPSHPGLGAPDVVYTMTNSKTGNSV